MKKKALKSANEVGVGGVPDGVTSLETAAGDISSIVWAVIAMRAV
ncbi:hypothetical protein [Caballeronia cordobensis]